MSIAESVTAVRVMVTANHLRDALTACMLSVGKDATLPTLMTVQIEKRAGELVFRSTDRFRLTRVTVTLDAGDMPSPDWTVLVASEDVKRILSAIPKGHVHAVPVALEWLDDAGRDFGGHAVHGLSVDTGETGMRVQAYDGDYPRMDNLVPSDDTDTVEMGEVRFDPKRLADLCKMPGRLKTDSVSLRLRGDGKGAISVWGDDTIRFEHMIMPHRKNY